MARFNINNLRVLVADDFSSFRVAIGTMLSNLGVMKIDNAGSADEAIAYCEDRKYDVVLSDHDLADGRTGQHVLEEIRHRELLPPFAVFIMISGDASRDVVMSAYDCQPDDYLAKPINAHMLEKRMIRLLQQRIPLKPAYEAIEKGDHRTAMILLTDLSISETRSAVLAQKLLGELFLDQGEFDKADKLYSKVLGVRELEWARLGLAKVKLEKGELALAKEYSQKLIRENNLFLPAYDVLAETWKRDGEPLKMQQTIERATEISPISILRHKKLSKVSEDNGDILKACSAMTKTVRLGERSVHGCLDDGLRLGRLVAKVPEELINDAPNLAGETIGLIQSAKQHFKLSEAQQVQIGMVEARVQMKKGNESKAQRMVEHYEEKCLQLAETGIEIDIDRVQAFQDVGDEDQADVLLRQMLQKYSYDQEALEKLDSLLDEPVSEANKTIVANVNREGIDLYNQSKFDEALKCFDKARKLFPKHAGIQLNIVQALLGKVRNGEKNDEIQKRVFDALDLVGRLIDPDYSQFKRYQKLNQMANDLL